jgi:acyl-CoA thioester hydrolase
MFPFNYPLEIRYAETDQMGMVHHSNYAVWFELARIACFRNSGYPYHQMETEGFLIPVLSLETQFKSPARFGMEITLEVDFFWVSPLVFGFKYKVMHQNNLLATGQTTHVFINSAQKPIRPPTFFKNIFNKG